MKKKIAKPIEAYRKALRSINPGLRLLAIILVVVIAGLCTWGYTAYYVKPVTAQTIVTPDAGLLPPPVVQEDGTVKPVDPEAHFKPQTTLAKDQYAASLAVEALKTCPADVSVLLGADEAQAQAWLDDPEAAAQAFVEANPAVAKAAEQTSFLTAKKNERNQLASRINTLQANTDKVAAVTDEAPIAVGELKKMAASGGIVLDEALFPVPEDETVAVDDMPAPAELCADFQTKAQTVISDLTLRHNSLDHVITALEGIDTKVANVWIKADKTGAFQVNVLHEDIKQAQQISQQVAGYLHTAINGTPAEEGKLVAKQVANGADRTIPATAVAMVIAFAVALFLLYIVPENDLFGTEEGIRSVSYAKWGYIFLLPFFVTFIVFTVVPLARTFYYSVLEQRMEGLIQVPASFVGLDNFVKLFRDTKFLQNLGNTMTMWLLGFIPQIIVSLALAVWFTDHIMKLKYQPFFKTVIYMPNLIMASAFSMLFFVLFSNEGPVNKGIESLGMEAYRFLAEPFGSRFLIALMNFMMWFGNTTIILMAAIMGIDTSMFEAAEIDGASAWKTFTHVTVPMIMPVLSYTLITSLIGGLQMFDVPQILTSAAGSPNGVNRTVIMQLNSIIGQSKNYGEGGALSVVLFIITAILGMVVYYSLNGDEREAKKLQKQARAKVAAMQKGGVEA